MDVLAKYREQLHSMYSDLCSVIGKTPPCSTEIIFGDARQRHYRDNLSDIIETASVDLAFTSPPYLNNYDYADRTRLETYFFGETVSWGDITSKIRTRLMMSATTQINRNDYNKNDLLDSLFRDTSPQVTDELDRKIKELSVRRLGKGGKKSYDILVAGYFNDMFKVLKETYRVLKDNAFFILILGDSAPYGVYIPTDSYLGEIGRTIGFRGYEIDVLRKRGDKWKENPQRHREDLRESMLILQK
ncbi:MAG: hypothetical protein IT210_20980 [Armatimonadetes bacterium]|nr:hypothetical protein [Armatimonadota bacterium]